MSKTVEPIALRNPEKQAQPLMSRRTLLKASLNGMVGAGAFVALPGWALAGDSPSEAAASGQHELWVSAQGKTPQGYAMSWVSPELENLQQQIAQSALSGFRGHGAAQHPKRPDHAVMFSRSPGTQGVEVNLATGEKTRSFASAAGHHMHGHGCFSADGAVLYTTESDYRTGQGKLMVRDGSDYRIFDQFDTQGVGPHDVHLMPDGKQLVVANGGLRTHPDSGREVLNLDSMKSSLVYLGARSGELLEQQTIAESKASIRHLGVAEDGTVALATQVQRSAMQDDHLVALAGIHKQGQPIQMLDHPDAVIHHFNDYMGSVAIHNQSRLVGFSSPRGDLVGFWHLDTGELAGYHAFHDVCGLMVSHDQRHFVLSNSRGDIRLIRTSDLKEDRALRMHFPEMSWDNHFFSFVYPADERSV